MRPVEKMAQAGQNLAKSARMNLELRNFEPSQYERYAQIRNPLFSDNQLSAHELKSFDDNLDRKKYYQQRYTCINTDTGEIIGFGIISHLAFMFNPHRYQGGILVDMNHQNKGVGQYIYENLMKDLRELKATEFWGFAREDMPASLRFIAKRGFHERFRAWESTLDPAAVDLSKFSHYVDKTKAAGVEMSTLSQELENDPDCYRKLYELNQTLFADVPGPEPYTPLPYEQWLSFDMKDPGLLPEAYTIAKVGDKYVGLSTARRLDKEPRGLHQLLTGVRREYRGKGIAFAMKLKVLEYSQKNGIQRIKTENATNNAPMLAVNLKLGFKRGVGLIAFSKTL